MKSKNDAGRVQLMADKCSTCVFRPGNMMGLRPGRLKELSQPEGALQCHKTLDGMDPGPTFGYAVCRGWYDVNKHRSQITQVMDRLDGWEEVPAP